MSDKSNAKTGKGTRAKVSVARIILPALILTAICATSTLILAFTNMLTEGKIAENADAKTTDSRMSVLEADNYKQLDDEGRVYEAVDSDGRQIGVIVITQASGYNGEIEVMTGIRSNGRVSGVTILSMSETGSGEKTKESDFLNQFIGANDPDLAVDKDGGSIDAVSGATVSSRAVTDAVNGAIAISVAFLDSTYAQ